MHSAIQKVEPSGTIVNRTTQLFGYADDIALMGRNPIALKELFSELAKGTKILALKINENKTKYLSISNLQARKEPRNLSIGEYDFEGVREFSYLGTNINSENKVNEDIQRRIMAGNRAYFAFIKLLRLMSKDTKMKLYKAPIRPVVTYCVQAWPLRSADEPSLSVFERKILRAYMILSVYMESGG
jgi:hypothetical protein